MSNIYTSCRYFAISTGSENTPPFQKTCKLSRNLFISAWNFFNFSTLILLHYAISAISFSALWRQLIHYYCYIFILTIHIFRCSLVPVVLFRPQATATLKRCRFTLPIPPHAAVSRDSKHACLQGEIKGDGKYQIRRQQATSYLSRWDVIMGQIWPIRHCPQIGVQSSFKRHHSPSVLSQLPWLPIINFGSMQWVLHSLWAIMGALRFTRCNTHRCSLRSLRLSIS